MKGGREGGRAYRIGDLDILRTLLSVPQHVVGLCESGTGAIRSLFQGRVVDTEGGRVGGRGGVSDSTARSRSL